MAFRAIETKEKEYHAAIGRFIVQFSHLEFILKLWTSETVGIPDEFQNQIISHDFAMLCTIAQKVLPHGLAEGADKPLKPLINKFRKLNEERVRIVHGWWLVQGSRPFLSHVSRSQLEPSAYYENPSEIEALADQVDQLELELRAWERAHRLVSD